METSIISALGFGSGIDTVSLVSQLVEAEKAPQQASLDAKKETLDAQISAYGTLKSSLSEFQGLLEPLANNDTFNSRAVSFPETDVVTPNSLGANAQVGSYQLEVIEVAQAQSLAVSTTASDTSSAINVSGNLTISLGSWTYDETDPENPIPQSFALNETQTAINIAVTADDSLQDIADKINDADSDVQASVLLVDGNYQLMISAPSGESNALQITSDDASKDTDGLSAFEFNADYSGGVTETQQGQDAHLKLNGLDVYRDSNEIDDVMQGLSFSINKASPGEKFTFSISEEKDSAETAIRDFVEGYNNLYNTLQALTGISTDADTNETTQGDLATDGTAKNLLSRIRSMIGDAVPGVSDFNALTNLGIRTELDGTLGIDEDDFETAMADQFDQVAAIFSPQTSSTHSGVDVVIGSYATETVSGTYSGSVTTSPTKGSVLSDAVFAAFNTDDTPAGDFTFAVSVDGTTSGELTLSGDFTTAEELRAELQTLINSDSEINSTKSFVDVTINDDGKIELQSRQYGSTSKVQFAASTGTDFATATGLSNSSTATTGVDAAGMIEGVAAFGSGEVLLPEIGSDPYGLNITVEEGATGDFSFTFSRGFAGELSLLIDNFLSSTGVIQSREDSINNQLDGIEDDQESLDRKMSITSDRLTQQYLAMEQIIASFSSTSDSLTGLTDRLPFTYSS
ncbi:flagellar filament capping protein FliD [Amphritea sp. 2_MG-2023]|uniref:flagellar filament capping protein FliD n=1 Tax=Amphritea TaxID=515417 RepID=UPI001C06C904|nr:MULTISPECIES: flagellar filament capping protein FliD [Amphritea]MBU2964835.1 flagellar filament capping protein FliD [Amphritea atlantica]MDO6419590.1 flagellar filament capping protein FliD [Amphritea sp. 2_MG-2023]